MRTIAVTTDEDLLERVDELARRGTSAGRNRSRIIRQAVREYVSRLEQQAEQEREAGIVHRHRARLERQAQALIEQQAKP